MIQLTVGRCWPEYQQLNLATVLSSMNQKFVHVIDHPTIWVDFYSEWTTDKFRQILVQSNTKKIIFFDWLHGGANSEQLSSLTALAQQYLITWVTQNQRPPTIPNVNIVVVDYMWNRSKQVYLDKKLGWKHSAHIEDYLVKPADFTRQRSAKFISVNNRVNAHRRELISLLSAFAQNNFLSTGDVETIIPGNVSSQQRIYNGWTVPPADNYIQNSYMSFQIESFVSHQDNTLLISEKTYDPMLLGLMTINFGPCGFNHYLLDAGWRLTEDVDWRWDLVEDDSHRFRLYLKEVKNLVSRTHEKLHEIYVRNRENICWNQERLFNKPYNYILT